MSPVHFTKLSFRVCSICNETFYTKSPEYSFYCNVCRARPKENKRRPYQFKFNVSDFPDLFDLTLIKNVGWYSPRRYENRNLISGLTRDHKVSISEAVENNYDPYYISHPCNCELMTQSNNSSKKTRSSMTYEELVVKVDSYNKMVHR